MPHNAVPGDQDCHGELQHEEGLESLCRSSSAQVPGQYASTSTARVSAAQGSCLQWQRCHPLAHARPHDFSMRQAAPPYPASHTATGLAVSLPHHNHFCQLESLPCRICRLPAHLFEHQVGSLWVHMEVKLGCGGDVALVLSSAHDVQPLHCSTGEAAVPSATVTQVPQSAAPPWPRPTSMQHRSGDDSEHRGWATLHLRSA